MNPLEEESLEFHERSPRGKIHTGLSKPIETQKDLSLAYTPGVAGPCRKIHENPDDVFKYTNKGNLVAVITNGTAVLGLGNIGPMAGKPVMEGKAVLFKKYADIDVFDLELDASDPETFINAVKALEPTFGGINLEDIKAPECFYIEDKLKQLMQIPVFHDDQHGTAIIATSAFLNAAEVTKRKIEEVKVVFSGAGAAAIACARLFLKVGVRVENLLMCDTKGVIYKGRTDLNKFKEEFMRETPARTLADALKGADMFVGVSGPGVLTGAMLLGMNEHPIIFALANPDPEITPAEARAARPDAIVATGRSDYPNQVNNVLGFPFIFRGALDVSAREINDEMKLAAARAIADLAKEDVPDEVMRAYSATIPYTFGRDYLIPKPVDPRVLLAVAPAVAEAAMKTGVARRPVDIKAYREQIEQILGPTKRLVRHLRNDIAHWGREQGRRPTVVIPHGHDDRVIKAALQLYIENDVQVKLLGSIEHIKQVTERKGLKDFLQRIEVIDPSLSPKAKEYAESLFNKRHRKGITQSAARELLRNPNYFASSMLAHGDVDGVISGLVETYTTSLRPILETVGCPPGSQLTGIYIINYKKKLYFLADCTITVNPNAAELAAIASAAAQFAGSYTKDPVRLAFLSFSSFGSNRHPDTQVVAEAREILSKKNPDFLFDGEMQADVALNPRLQERDFPFCGLGGTANVLIFPNLSSANIAYKMLSSLQEVSGIGPLLHGLKKPANVMERVATTEEIINMVYITAHAAVTASRKQS